MSTIAATTGTTAVSSISPVTTQPAASTTSTSSVPASVSAQLSFDAGVVATLGGAGGDSADSTTQLYTNLAAASNVGTSAVDINSEWANVVNGNPALAPMAAQIAADQALLNAVL